MVPDDDDDDGDADDGDNDDDDVDGDEHDDDDDNVLRAKKQWSTLKQIWSCTTASMS